MRFSNKIIITVLLAGAGTVLAAQERRSCGTETVLSDSLATDSAAAETKPYPARAVEAIDSLLKDGMFETSQVGLMVYDLDGDSLLYARNGRQLMRPASTMKLLTAITALDRLGAKYRFATSVYHTGNRDSTTLHGDIYLRGGMDPSLEMYDIDCLVEGIASLHVDTIRGRIVADRSFKDSGLMGEGWCWDDDNPVLSPLVFQRKDNLTGILRKKLEALGITVLGGDSTGAVPAGAVCLQERYSPLEPVLARMMKNSDNLYAEAVYYQTAAAAGKPATAKAAREAERQVMRKAGLDPSRYRLADGSGLSLYNYLSAEAEVRLLRYAYREKGIFGTLCQSLPSAGVDGTLRKRMLSGPAHDNVRAKTGTLAGIYSLAGYCTAPTGNLLAFCIINQGVMHARNAHDFQDRVCQALCR